MLDTVKWTMEVVLSMFLVVSIVIIEVGWLLLMRFITDEVVDPL